MKGAGHADMYDLPINFIKGHNPDLVIFDDESGEETERIKLNVQGNKVERDRRRRGRNV